uniref:Biogenesis of lysosome-related organelles complex 1 subunit 7 n=1 Tax=Panagrellus redivivus TaxID=6233 RepID=A0A7E4V808_PANRE
MEVMHSVNSTVGTANSNSGAGPTKTTITIMADDTIWSRTMSMTPVSSEAKTAASVSVSSSSQSRTPSKSPIPELIRAEEMNEVLKRTTRSIIRTLNFASTTQQQFTEVNLNVASSINDRYNEISELGARIDSAITAIPKTVELPPNIIERLLARIKGLFEMIEIRQASLRKLVTETNSYMASANVGEMCETVEETHRRLLLIQKHITAGRDLSLPCPKEPTDEAVTSS